MAQSHAGLTRTHPLVNPTIPTPPQHTTHMHTETRRTDNFAKQVQAGVGLKQ
jgi:hypothetical protein